MKVIWSPTSKRNLETIVDFISDDNPNAAAALVDEIEKITESLKQHPRRGRKTPTLNDDQIREVVISGSYVLIYRMNKSLTEILTVRHTRQGLNRSDLNFQY